MAFPTTDELLSVASGVFEYMSTYREPLPPPITPGDDEERQMAGDGGDAEEENASVVVRDETPIPKDDSDIDDLFSAPSDSPGPPEALEPVTSAEDTSDPLVESLPNTAMPMLDGDFLMSSPTRPAVILDGVDDRANGLDVAKSVTEYDFNSFGGVAEGFDSTNLVTEDDFDFFDSPVERKEKTEARKRASITPATITKDQGEPERGKQEALEQPINHSGELPSGGAEDLDNFGLTQGVTLTEDGLHNVDLIDQLDTGKQTDQTSIFEEDPGREVAEGPSRFTSDLDVLVEKPTPFKRHTPDSLRLVLNLIPSMFEPIPLAPESELPSLAYLPSPAPTSHSLRPSLFDRLSQKKAGSDYASAWGIDSESSGEDDDDAQDGAPPTPESIADTTESSSPRQSTIPIDGRRTETEIEWEGVTCVGAEWLAVKDDRQFAAAHGRPWNPRWAETGNAMTTTVPGSPISVKPELRPDKLSLIDCDRFASELIGNRHFRALFAQEAGSGRSSPLEVQVYQQDGVRLSDLVAIGGGLFIIPMSERY